MSPLVVQYDQHPEVHAIDQHFVDTGPLPADGDRVVGLELAGLSGPLNASAEAAFLKVDSIVPGVPAPKFSGGFVELGYFLTGETRPYVARNWEHVAPMKPIGSGGFGAVEVLAKIDYLDLQDPHAFVAGGRQTAYLLGLNWHPMDCVKLMANLAAIHVVDGPYFRKPSGHDTVDVVGLRGQVNW